MPQILFLTVIFFLFPFCPTMAAPPPMVERHIFAPKPEITEKPLKPPVSRKLEKELSFTGVIFTPEGRSAMIQEMRGGRNDERRRRYKEGDEIKGLLIKEIGRNYVILSDTTGDVRLNLYQGSKSRPAAPPEPRQTPAATQSPEAAPAAPKTIPGQQPQTQAQAGPSGQGGVSAPDTGAAPAPDTGDTGETVQPPSTAQPADNPFVEAMRKAMEKRKNQAARQPQPDLPPNNPFAELLRRAQER